ncbi:MAG: NAD(+) synthase [Myxococcales bacterium]|nr:NAD(+) synthase [Myxococcales bacterium]
MGTFSRDVLTLADPIAVADALAQSLRNAASQTLRRRGLVVGISGGIDSALCTALAVRAFGASKVFGLFLPERVSSSESLTYGRLLAEKFGIETAVEDLAPALTALGCYARQDEAIREVFPLYDSATWKSKIVIPSLLEESRLSISRVTVERPDGTQESAPLPLKAYLKLVAATNFKQRLRTTLEYYHADRLNYAVVGTPNRLEYDQGFFVKGGDGLADVKPIAHLYKTQVYALARALGVPDEICNRAPTTDTFSLPQGQDEFYYALPYPEMDLCLYAHNHGVAAAEVAAVMGVSADTVERVFKDIDAKRRATRPLHLTGLLLEAVPEISK